MLAMLSGYACLTRLNRPGSTESVRVLPSITPQERSPSTPEPIPTPVPLQAVGGAPPPSHVANTPKPAPKPVVKPAPSPIEAAPPLPAAPAHAPTPAPAPAGVGFLTLNTVPPDHMVRVDGMPLRKVPIIRLSLTAQEPHEITFHCVGGYDKRLSVTLREGEKRIIVWDCVRAELMRER